MAVRPGRKLLFAALTTLLFMVGLELVLRVTTHELGKATIPDDRVLQHVQQGGFVHDPLYGWVRDPLPLRVEGIDANQFRTSEEILRAKPEGGWRAFTMGDSQTYGAGVDVDDSYSAVAQRLLRQARPDQRIQVVNTGTSGYGSLQSLRLIRHKLPAWSPDLYIVDASAHDQPRDDKVPIDPRYASLDRLLFRWRTWYVLRYAVAKSQDALLGPRQDEDWDDPLQPWQREGRHGNHDLIMVEAARQDRPVIFLDYPIWEMHQDRLECQARPELLPEGAVVVETCPALRDSGLPLSELFYDNNHLTVAGNEIVGKVLADFLLGSELGP